MGLMCKYVGFDTMMIKNWFPARVWALSLFLLGFYSTRRYRYNRGLGCGFLILRGLFPPGFELVISFNCWMLLRFTQLKKQGSHRTHCDLWFKCYNPKRTFSTIIREYKTCFGVFFVSCQVGRVVFFWFRFEVELAIKTNENGIFIVLCYCS